MRDEINSGTTVELTGAWKNTSPVILSGYGDKSSSSHLFTVIRTVYITL